MAREWRTEAAPEDFHAMSVMDLLRLIKTKVALMDEQYPGVTNFDEAVTLLGESTKTLVATMVVIEKLVVQNKHLREHIEGDMPSDN